MPGQLEALLDPSGLADNAVVGALAPRTGRLEGARLGLLNSSKPNSAVVLEQVAELLRVEYGVVGAVMLTKPTFAVPAGDELVAELAEQCDLAIAGVGD